MDYGRIKLLLEVFRNSLDVPHTDKIRAEIIEELKGWNAPQGLPDVAPAEEEPELSAGGRRL